MKKYKDLEIYKSFVKSKLFCTKASSYFYFYEDLLQKYRGKEIIFVEIGVQRGGSLLMWRDWLGPKARIIGIDVDENAKNMGLKFLLVINRLKNSGKNFLIELVWLILYWMMVLIQMKLKL